LIIVWKAESLAQISQQSVVLQVNAPGESITYALSKSAPAGRSDQSVYFNLTSNQMLSDFIIL